jgi:hypothetical protein
MISAVFLKNIPNISEGRSREKCEKSFTDKNENKLTNLMIH